MAKLEQLGKVKNVQVIDGAQNCSYEVFSVSDEDFEVLFPLPEQDVEFSDDFFRLAPLKPISRAPRIATRPRRI